MWIIIYAVLAMVPVYAENQNRNFDGGFDNTNPFAAFGGDNFNNFGGGSGFDSGLNSFRGDLEYDSGQANMGEGGTGFEEQGGIDSPNFGQQNIGTAPTSNQEKDKKMASDYQAKYMNAINSLLSLDKYKDQIQRGIPISQHIDVSNPVPVPEYKHVQVPVAKPFRVAIPYPVLVGVPQPYPIEVPINKPVIVPYVQEIKIPIEKLVPYPVVKNVPYPVTKYVPYHIEKQVKVEVSEPFPVNVPILKTIIHKTKKYNSEDRDGQGNFDSITQEEEDSSNEDYKFLDPIEVQEELNPPNPKNRKERGHQRYENEEKDLKESKKQHYDNVNIKGKDYDIARVKHVRKTNRNDNHAKGNQGNFNWKTY